MISNSIGLAVCMAIVYAGIYADHADAQDIQDKYNVYGTLAAASQQQWIQQGPAGAQDTSRGSFVFQPEIEIHPSEYAMIFAKMGFAAGNGLNDGTAPFSFAPWAVEMENDVKNINGSNRDYLLTAWYRHRLQTGRFGRLDLTVGMIDATNYLDENVYSNDPYAQFMNAALVNAPDGFMPSFDFGGALEWLVGGFTTKAVVMNAAGNDDDQYTFYGIQVGYAVLLPQGLGNYRVILSRTGHDFAADAGGRREPGLTAMLSCDQAINDRFGLWIRLGFRDTAIDFQNLFSGGIQFAGKSWGRVNDTLGAGLAFLDGGNRGPNHSYIFETYYRLGLTNMASITADLQYLTESVAHGGDARGLILGLRAVVVF